MKPNISRTQWKNAPAPKLIPPGTQPHKSAPPKVSTELKRRLRSSPPPLNNAKFPQESNADSYTRHLASAGLFTTPSFPGARYPANPAFRGISEARARPGRGSANFYSAYIEFDIKRSGPASRRPLRTLSTRKIGEGKLPHRRSVKIKTRPGGALNRISG